MPHCWKSHVTAQLFNYTHLLGCLQFDMIHEIIVPDSMYVINKPFVNYKDINEYFAAQILRLNAGE